MIKQLSDMLQLARSGEKARLVVVAAQDKEVLEAVIEAHRSDVISPILVGDAEKIEQLLETMGAKVDDFEILDAKNLEEAAAKGLQLFKEGRADFIMKGLIDTSILLKAVLNKEYGLRSGSLLSHVMIYEPPGYHKLLGLTDGGMNISPGIEEKKVIVENGLQVFRALGYECVKVAGLAAKEKVSPKMQSTVDADALKELLHHEDMIYEGPLALDLVLDREAAKVKGFQSDIAGDVDLMLVPGIDAGNALGKAITYLAGGESAGIIMGAKVPIVLVSRADTAKTKLYSIALGKLIAQYNQRSSQ